MSLRDELKRAKQECLLTRREYIRSDFIREVLTIERVKEELPNTWGRWLLPCWDWDLQDKVQQARKIIAILILLGKSEAIDDLLAEGLTDDDLPLRKKDDKVISQCGKKAFTSFKTCRGSKELREMFLEAQWIVFAPTLDFEPGRSVDIDLHPLSVLPFDCDEPTTAGYSVVYKARPWPSYCRGLDCNVSSLCLLWLYHANIHCMKAGKEGKGLVYVAIKKFNDASKHQRDSHFRAELKNLNLINNIKNDHLIKHLAVCEHLQCIFFPWADGGDLRAFWKTHDLSVCRRTADVFHWAIQQITGLTEALAEIHKTGSRHGDLKPSNILHFTGAKSQFGILKIADFGVSRTHERATGFREAATITTASTYAYEAPEAYDPNLKRFPRSRRYDSWSMGCIILEFVIWLLYDYKALSSFEYAREFRDHAYYQPIPNSNPIVMEVHPMVKKAIKGLKVHPRFHNTTLEALVEMVESELLRVDPKKRLYAVDMHMKLKTILDATKKDLSSFARAADRAPITPSIFSNPPPPSPNKATYEQVQGPGSKSLVAPNL